MSAPSAEQQAADYKQSGNSAIQGGRFEEAVAMFSMGIELQPGNEVLWSNRSAAYCRLKRYDRAMSDAEEVLRLKPGWGRGHSRKAAALDGLGRAEDALAAYTTALRCDPDNQAVKSAIERLAMAREQRREDEREEQGEMVQAARRLQEEGNRAKKEGDLPRAVALYSEAMGHQKDGEKLAALYSNRSACSVLLEEPAKALEDALKCIELRPDWARGYTRRGAALWALGRLREARNSYIEALVHDSTNGEIQETVLRIERDMEAAAKRAEEGDSPEVLALQCKNKGNDLFKVGDNEGALREYSQGLEHHPTHYVLFSNRAAVYQKMNRLEEAMKDTVRCIELAPEFVKGYIRKASIIEQQAEGNSKKLKGAIRAYLKAVELDPENEQWHDRAIDLEQRIREAEERAAAVAKHASNMNALGAVVVVEEKSRQQVAVVEDPEVQGDRKFEFEDFPGAIGWYSKAIKKDPKKQNLYVKRGICWDKVRRYQKALADFDQAMELCPDDLRSLRKKAECFIRCAGQRQDADPNEASECFDKAIAALEEGVAKDADNKSEQGFADALEHARNEKIGFEMTKADRLALLERTKARAERRNQDGPGLDWKNMSDEEKKRRQADMKRKREEACFDSYLVKQQNRGHLKEVGVAAAKKNKKFHTSVAAKFTYTADGL